MRVIILFGLGIVLTLSGCATIIDGKSQSVTFQSTPSGADVYINGVVKGTTPLTIDVPRAENTSLRVTKEGYEDVTMTLPTTLNGMFWGNILFGGLPGSTTDAATGASKEYVPNVHLVSLQEQ